MRWYVVHLLFAQLPKDEKSSGKCESCHVLFHAVSALAAYDKGVAWAQSHIEDTNFHFVGVEHIHSLDDDPPVDGTEIGGSFFDEENIWERQGEFIPEKENIPAIMWEANSGIPVGELMTEKQKKDIKEIFGED
jgi:hypothetical protein